MFRSVVQNSFLRSGTEVVPALHNWHNSVDAEAYPSLHFIRCGNSFFDGQGMECASFLSALADWRKQFALILQSALLELYRRMMFRVRY
jgi:hypothetical protein